MTLIYELDVKILKMYLRTNKNIQSKRRTPPKPPPPTGEEGSLQKLKEPNGRVKGSHW